MQAVKAQLIVTQIAEAPEAGGTLQEGPSGGV